jgi:aspartate racemase
MKSRLVGILGGVGPMATVYFMEMLLKKTNASKDQEHLDMLVSNHATIPDRTAYILGKSEESPLDVMVADAKMLEAAGCDFIVLPCNTAHYFFEKIQQSIHIPLLNIIQETVSYCERRIPGVKRIGIMATEGTICSNTYGMACETHGLKCVVPESDIQSKVTEIIYHQVKAGKPVSKREFTAVIDALREKGCDAVVLGCTELSVAFADLNLQPECPDVVDSLTVLAEQTILFAGKELKTPCEN